MKAPAFDAEPRIALVDGPMRGQWYYAADWTARVESARYMAARNQRPSVCLEYVETQETVSHPDGVNGGRVWRWSQ